VNAGIYVLEPETLDYVPENEFFDMPDLFKRLIDHGKSATVFPVREYWQDVGRKEDFHRVNGEYDDVFDK
jgi:NDP-sugar pyrophosphorylase family protein